jgi:hypothetical protein
VLPAARDPDTVGSGKDLHYLRHAYSHRFTAPVRRSSEYVSGTSLARSFAAVLNMS